MKTNNDYLEVNKASWNKRTTIHVDSDFYDNDNFIKGQSSLNSIELNLLGDIKGKSILHLQCHFGQDTISLSRMGASVTGVDLSDEAVKVAQELAEKTTADATFICSDIYSLPEHLDEQFDIVFTSYGTIGWLPDIDRWAGIVSRFLKPEGQFVFVEFHPVVWMFDDDFSKIQYNYSNAGPIQTNETSYTESDSSETEDFITWNHGLAEVFTALISNGVQIKEFQEFDYSPYNCFNGTEKIGERQFRIKDLGNKIPMVYALLGQKQG